MSESGAARDVSTGEDHVDGVDRADAGGAADRSEASDRSTTADTASADRPALDAVDALVDTTDEGQATPDGQSDSSVCDVDAGRSPTDNPCIVSERYGIFVAPNGSDATGAGTRAAPFQTINRGLQASKRETMRVFVCDNGAGFVDPVAIDATLDGLAVYGGFECVGWTLAANARTRIHPPTGPALSISDLTVGVTLENLDLQAADAAPSASSIAVRIQSSLQVLLRNSRLLAGKGGAGHSGSNGVAGPNGEPVGPSQLGKPASCTPPIGSQAGGIAISSSCGSKGGNGGACDVTLGSLPGGNGSPTDNVDPPNQANGGTHWLEDRSGRKGSDGVAGSPGAANSKAGMFSGAGYTLAAPGADGADGHAAQGGGGGSAGEPDLSNWCVGASGGAGGMGGCGGTHGTGGGAGGAAVALLSWMSGITLDKCELISADGGPGGNGGGGGAGGLGALGAEGGDGIMDVDAGASLVGAGMGGPGGKGGTGGGGAGGNGGPTYGIVYAGGRPSQIGGTTVVRGAGGAKGIGGGTGIVSLPDGGATDGGMPDGSGTQDGGVIRAADGLSGDAAYELAVP
ncbi:MAG TPA: hypothetical protein VK550_35620 [Polyangiaceae bacterium]|nr:hypothetical protein [Polyangiaceae bacterium]